MISAAERTLRRRQILGLVWIALAVILFTIARAGRHAIFLARWWRLW
jgi:hypothetical protein